MRSLSFPNVTPAMWEELKGNVAKDLGAAIEGNSGEGTKDGIKFSYVYEPDTKTLWIKELSRSWYDPSEDAIEKEIRAGVQSAL